MTLRRRPSLYLFLFLGLVVTLGSLFFAGLRLYCGDEGVPRSVLIKWSWPRLVIAFLLGSFLAWGNANAILRRRKFLKIQELLQSYQLQLGQDDPVSLRIGALAKIVIRDHLYFPYCFLQHNLAVLEAYSRIELAPVGEIEELIADYSRILADKVRTNPSILLHPDVVDIDFSGVEALRLEERVEQIFRDEQARALEPGLLEA